MKREKMKDQWIFSVEEAEITAKNYVLKKGCSQRLMRRLFALNCVEKNGAVIHRNELLVAGDELALHFPPEEASLSPDAMPLDILYEDEDFLVVNKQAAMAVMPTHNHPKNTVAGAVWHYFRSRGIFRKVRFLGRLDKDTTGVLVVCKNPYVHGLLVDRHTHSKEYLALVEGEVTAKETIDLPIGIGERSLLREVRPDGQAAVTHVTPLAVLEEGSLLSLRLETGRTHQIRVHLSHLGHPIVGDGLYGNGREGEGTFLHVYELELWHPRRGELMNFVAPLPGKWNRIIMGARKISARCDTLQLNSTDKDDTGICV